MGLKSSRQSLQTGQILFRQGDEITALFRVERGFVNLSIDGLDLGQVGKGGWINAADLFRPTHAHTAQAAANAEISVHGKTALGLYLKAHPDLMAGFAATIAHDLDHIRLQAGLLRLKGAEDKVLASLKTQGGRHSGQPLTQWASQLGLTREALYRTLAKLEDRGLIVRDGRRVKMVGLSPHTPTGETPEPL